MSEAEDLIAEVERHKATMGLALTVDGMSGLLQALSRQTVLHDGVTEIKRELQHSRAAETRIEISGKRKKILDSFGPIDPYKNHHTSLKLRHPGTGLWLTESDEFKHWLKTPNAKLWLYGIPGAGKTVLASSVIQQALRESGRDIATAFYYCDYKDPVTQDPINILGSLAKQIAKQDEQSFEKLQRFFQNHHPDEKPSNAYNPDDLRDLVIAMTSSFESAMVVVDALDECGQSTSHVTELLASLNMGREKSTIKTLFFSRNEQDIRDFLEDYTQVSIAARSSDLRLYVGAEIELRTRKKKLRIKDPSLKEHIMERLVDGADGMFRWVACQMDYLCELTTDAARRKALESLPPTLEATYERILRRVNESNKDVQKLVHRTLRWIVHSDYGLSIAGLCKALSVNSGDTFLNREAVPEEDEVLRWCSSLVRRSASDLVLELAHFTVKEFLLGIESSSHSEFHAYHIDHIRDNTELAEVCLKYLLLQDFAKLGTASQERITQRNMEYAFREYAVIRWTEHARECMTEATILSLMRQLFDPLKPNVFITWAQEYMWFGTECCSLDELNIPLAAMSTLHCAAALAFTEMCSWLLQVGGKVNQSCAGGTPLHCALLGTQCWYRPSFGTDYISWRKERSATIRVLLEAGADPNCYYNSKYSHISPLDIAASNRYRDAFIELLKNGAIFDTGAARSFDEWASEGGAGLEVSLEVLETIGKERLREEDYAIFLEHAIRAEDVEATRSLARRDRCLSRDRLTQVDYHTSLRLAAQLGQTELLNGLLRNYQLDVDSTDEVGCTALHYSAGAGHVSIMKLLLDQGAGYNSKDLRGRTPLHHAVEASDTSCLSILLEQQIDVLSGDLEGLTVWHLAAQRNHVPALRVLQSCVVDEKRFGRLEAGAGTALEPCAAPTGSQALALLGNHHATHGPQLKSLDGSSPLHLASKAGSLEAVTYLIQNGFDPSSVCGNGSNSLHYVVDNSDGIRSPDLVDVLLDKGVDPCSANIDGKTPMHVLVGQDLDSRHSATQRELILQKLIQHAADLNKIDAAGSTALHLACNLSPKDNIITHEWRQFAMEMLLKSGAGLKTLDRLNRSALKILVDVLEEAYLHRNRIQVELPNERLHMYASMVNVAVDYAIHDEALRKICVDPKLLVLALWLKQEELLHKLLDQSPNVDLKAYGMSGRTPIQAACRYQCRRPLFRLILQKSKAQSNAAGHRSELIRFVCQYNDPTTHDKVLELLEEDVDLNDRSPYGVTAFMLAARAGNLAILESLLSRGADTNATDSCGWSAIHHACAYGRNAILRVLQKFEIDWNAKVKVFSGTKCFQDVTMLHLAAMRIDSGVLEYLFENDLVTDINSISAQAETALLIASHYGNLQNVSFLLDRSADDKIVESQYGVSPLHAAAQGGHEEVVLTFIHHRCKAHLEDCNGLTPELYARKNGHIRVADILQKCRLGTGLVDAETKNHDASSRNCLQYSPGPLTLAIEIGDVQLCQRLVEEGANYDVGFEGCDGCTPLLYSLHHGKPEIAEYLVAQGASTAGNTCSKWMTRGYTAFHYATSMGWIRLLRLLLEKAPKDILISCDPIHPIHLAIANDKAECVELIIDHCRKGMIDKSEIRAIRMYERNADLSHRDCLEKDTLERLIDLPVLGDRIQWTWSITPFEEFFPEELYSATPLHIAANFQRTDIARSLLACRAIVDSTDSHYRTPLHFAAARGPTAMVDLLLDAGANPNASDSSLLTPCMHAASGKHLDLLQILMERGADLRLMDRYHGTALHYAARSCAMQVFIFLIYNTPEFELEHENIWGHSVLFTVLYNGSASLISFLLNFAPSLSAYYPRQSNSMNAAAERLKPSELRRLLRRLPQELIPKLLAHQGVDGGTPLYLATTLARRQYQPEIINMLLDAGADLELEGGDSGTPLMGACAHGRLEAVKLLVAKHARTSYMKDGSIISVLRAVKHHPEVTRWLLVRRFTDGPKWLTAGNVN